MNPKCRVKANPLGMKLNLCTAPLWLARRRYLQGWTDSCISCGLFGGGTGQQFAGTSRHGSRPECYLEKRIVEQALLPGCVIRVQIAGK